MTVTPDPALVIDLPLGLVVIYVLAIVIWYELLRRALLKQLTRRRRSRARRAEFEQWRGEEAELAAIGREAAEREAAEESEPDPARRYYYLARKTARAERDTAVDTANKAVNEAIGRIERRHREIEAALDQEESERVRGQLGHRTRGEEPS
jgi:hypothetical protein